MREHYLEKTRTGTSFILEWLFDFVSCLHDDGLFHIWLFEGSLHVDKIHTCAIQNRTRYTCATCPSPPADWFHTETGGHFVFTWYHFTSEQNSRSGTTTRVNCADAKVATGSSEHPLKVSNTSIIICSLVQYLLVILIGNLDVKLLG